MIARNRENIPIPRTLVSEECGNNLRELIEGCRADDLTAQKVAKKKISTSFYRGCNINGADKKEQDVVEALKNVYGNKCAFCESKKINPDIEHFRPKRGITGLKKSQHRGYYWLCYEWTNLLPICYECNKSKGNQFPILYEELRVSTPPETDDFLNCKELQYVNSPLIDEKPMLLHPEYDDNIEHNFKFDSKGKIIAVDTLERAETTIEVYKLNREDLLFFRKKEIDNIVEKFEVALTSEKEDIFQHCLSRLYEKSRNTDNEYSLLLKYTYENFEDVIVPLLPKPIRYRANQLYANARQPIVEQI
jgi:uncharacterized protein (TIGR02646 family)